MVSIHAPHAGRDMQAKLALLSPDGFNPRAPRGARLTRQIAGCILVGFQSTRPTRGATRKSVDGFAKVKVSIHAPHAGRDSHVFSAPGARRRFNPRAPRGARPSLVVKASRASMFQSTRPTRGATDNIEEVVKKPGVSIHAPHAGRDRVLKNYWSDQSCFNPRAPRGARRFVSTGITRFYSFQSTRPTRGATGFGL